jgi:hypothetical protein
MLVAPQCRTICAAAEPDAAGFARRACRFFGRRTGPLVRLEMGEGAPSLLRNSLQEEFARIYSDESES